MTDGAQLSLRGALTLIAKRQGQITFLAKPKRVCVQTFYPHQVIINRPFEGLSPDSVIVGIANELLLQKED